ncbi:uncharacterized protein LOC131590380 [Poecile atricapillus]|uniref:uncharacterized protein LOC131590380 n=1 Tax=Poecile atricapillus TaxID=48891 RepID=UPI0027396B77|nr:uncharacterized protein LOC131590380 [Poecile atricapillus]
MSSPHRIPGWAVPPWKGDSPVCGRERERQRDRSHREVPAGPARPGPLWARGVPWTGRDAPRGRWLDGARSPRQALPQACSKPSRAFLRSCSEVPAPELCSRDGSLSHNPRGKRPWEEQLGAGHSRSPLCLQLHPECLTLELPWGKSEGRKGREPAGGCPRPPWVQHPLPITLGQGRGGGGRGGRGGRGGVQRAAGAEAKLATTNRCDSAPEHLAASGNEPGDAGVTQPLRRGVPEPPGTGAALHGSAHPGRMMLLSSRFPSPRWPQGSASLSVSQHRTQPCHLWELPALSQPSRPSHTSGASLRGVGRAGPGVGIHLGGFPWGNSTPGQHTRSQRSPAAVGVGAASSPSTISKIVSV